MTAFDHSLVCATDSNGDAAECRSVMTPFDLRFLLAWSLSFFLHWARDSRDYATNDKPQQSGNKDCERYWNVDSPVMRAEVMSKSQP